MCVMRFWPYDFETTNPHFGSPDDLKSLVKSAHKKGIWVMVDIVANHMGYSNTLQYANFSSNENYCLRVLNSPPPSSN